MNMIDRGANHMMKRLLSLRIWYYLIVMVFPLLRRLYSFWGNFSFDFAHSIFHHHRSPVRFRIFHDYGAIWPHFHSVRRTPFSIFGLLCYGRIDSYEIFCVTLIFAVTLYNVYLRVEVFPTDLEVV